MVLGTTVIFTRIYPILSRELFLGRRSSSTVWHHAGGHFMSNIIFFGNIGFDLEGAKVLPYNTTLLFMYDILFFVFGTSDGHCRIFFVNSHSIN